VDVADKLKKAVLRVALERANFSVTASNSESTEALLTDIENALGVPAKIMVARAPDAKYISALNPVRVEEGNPNIEWIKAGLGEELAKPDEFARPDAYEKNPIGIQPENLNGALANTIDAMFWAYVNPASPFQNNPEVMTRFLRRALFYVDGLEKMANLLLARKRGFLDEFSLGPVSAPLREFAQLYPGLLLPSQKRQWDQGLRRVADAQLQDFGRFNGTYPNIDTARGYELLNLGLYLKDENLLNKARFIMTVQKKNVYPDGGVTYIRTQNPQQGYQYTVASYLGRYYEVTHDPEILEILKSMEWYGPVNGRSGEWWTASNWKAMWNSVGSDCGGPFVACVTGNPYLYGMMGNSHKYTTRKWRDARVAIAWYRNDIKPMSLPQNYTAIDRNIAGPRAWYGNFTYAATLRDINIAETGHGTIMGCMALDDQGDGRSIIPRIAPMVKIQCRGNKSEWAWITSDLKGAVSMGRNFSVSSATYSPATFGSSGKGEVADWTARQIWLGLPDRLIGLMEISPRSDQSEAFSVASYMQLGVGGPRKDVTVISPTEYQYGNFNIRLHEHNYLGVDLNAFDTRADKSFATEMVWRSEAPEEPHNGIPLVSHRPEEDARTPVVGGLTGTRKMYRRDQNFYNVVEIRTKAASGETTVKRLTSANGLLGLEIKAGVKSYVIWMNPTSQPQTALLAGSAQTSLHQSGAPSALPILPAPTRVTVPPNQHIVAVTSPDSEDHQPGWATFQAMLTAKGQNHRALSFASASVQMSSGFVLISSIPGIDTPLDILRAMIMRPSSPRDAYSQFPAGAVQHPKAYVALFPN
jgi:hypothetical protein